MQKRLGNATLSAGRDRGQSKWTRERKRGMRLCHIFFSSRIRLVESRGNIHRGHWFNVLTIWRTLHNLSNSLLAVFQQSDIENMAASYDCRVCMHIWICLETKEKIVFLRTVLNYRWTNIATWDDIYSRLRRRIPYEAFTCETNDFFKESAFQQILKLRNRIVFEKSSMTLFRDRC